jgi:hypothetical protein
MDADTLAEGWTVWNDDGDRLILAFRPDVFDGGAFPPECLPTIYLTRGRRTRRPGVRPNPRPGDPWVVTLFLEPEVDTGRDHYEDRAAALDGARELARRFSDGQVDYRDLYQVPRESYFEKLDELTGRGA